MHVLHHGRAEYTLIYPENPPRIEVHVRTPTIYLAIHTSDMTLRVAL